jgi:uncharacterized membrane protein YfhO
MLAILIGNTRIFLFYSVSTRSVVKNFYLCFMSAIKTDFYVLADLMYSMLIIIHTFVVDVFRASNQSKCPLW